MLRRTVLSLSAFASVLFVACSGGDGDDAVPSATLDSAPVTSEDSTTTSTEALTVEQQVEAAYLRSWAIYTEAMRTLDTSRLDEVYVDAALSVRIDEVNDLAAANTPARMSVEHNITAIAVEDGVATVRDEYTNHSVLLNADGSPAEPDPNEALAYEYVLRLIEGTWKVALVTPLG